MTRRELRIKRWQTFSANLSLYTEDKDVFLCPFCSQFFEFSSIDRGSESNFLVGAHVVPFTVSHTMRTTMCCFKCDNWFGTWFNSHESRRHAIRKLRSLGKLQKCYVRMADKGHEFGVSTLLDWSNPNNPGIEINHVVPLDDDRQEWFNEQVHQNVIKKSWDGDEVGLDYYGKYVNRRADLSYWHSAYLHMFHHYGYEWYESSQARAIKRQFELAEFPILPNEFIQPFMISPSLLSETTLYRRQPSTHIDYEQDGFFIVFPYVKPLKGHVAIYIPRDWNAPAHMPTQLSLDLTPEHKRLAHEKHLLPFHTK